MSADDCVGCGTRVCTCTISDMPVCPDCREPFDACACYEEPWDESDDDDCGWDD